MKVMLIDDFDTTLKAFKMALEDKGHEVIPILYFHNRKDIEKILETYRKENPNVCILDGLEGDALEIAKNLESMGAERIIIYSGDDKIVKEARDTGLEGYIKQEKRIYEIL